VGDVVLVIIRRVGHNCLLVFHSVAPRGNVAKLAESKNLTPEYAAKIQRMEGAHIVSFEDIRIGFQRFRNFAYIL
jgi:hypothetical protein